MDSPIVRRPEPRLTRRISDKDVFRLWRRHAHQAGEVITAWNDLHAALLGIFRTLTIDAWEMSLAIWHSHQSDRSQREMLISVATEARRFKSPKALARIRWLKDTVDKLAPFRNDPVHTSMSIAAFEKWYSSIEPD